MAGLRSMRHLLQVRVGAVRLAHARDANQPLRYVPTLQALEPAWSECKASDAQVSGIGHYTTVPTARLAAGSLHSQSHRETKMKLWQRWWAWPTFAVAAQVLRDSAVALSDLEAGCLNLAQLCLFFGALGLCAAQPDYGCKDCLKTPEQREAARRSG